MAKRQRHTRKMAEYHKGITETKDLTTKEGRRNSIMELWPIIAASAYECYLQNGRGAYRLDYDMNPTWVKRFETDNNQWTEEANGYIENYNPEDEIIVCFDLPELNILAISTYGVDDLTPPMAYKNLRNPERN